MWRNPEGDGGPWRGPTQRTAVRVTFLVLLLWPTVATPCGVDWPSNLLAQRAWTLLSPPVGSFAWNIRDLLPEVEFPFPVVESGDPDDAREEADRSQLTKAEMALVEAMRAADSAAAAYALGSELPEAVRLYTAGAVAFHLYELETAIQYFLRTLEAPQEDRAPRHLWASFMLGRLHDWDLEKASSYFAMTRRLVREGALDPLGLAAESYGAEALAIGEYQILSIGRYEDLTLGEFQEGSLDAMIGLYLQQAALGSQEAVSSLTRVASDYLAPAYWEPGDGVADWQLDAVEGVGRRLLFEYVVSHFTDEELLALGRQRLESLAGLDGQVPEPVVGERLVYLAYRMADYDWAESMAASFDTPMVQWVKGKLALRRGDLAAAGEAYGALVRSLPSIEARLTRLDGGAEALNQIQLESGILFMSRGEYLQAAELLYAAAEAEPWKRWGELAHLVERVLTLDEVRELLEQRLETPPKEWRESFFDSFEDQFVQDEPPLSLRLRALVARRLVREGHFEEALQYFDDEYLRSVAEDYGRHLKRAAQGWRLPVSRARSQHEAARIAYYEGMEILGYELAPDFARWGGSYTSYEFRGCEYAELDPEYCEEIEQQRRSYMGPDEAQRLAASAPSKDVRFHYREVAVDHARQAASLVPARSQAFAAMLCEAHGWAQDSASASELYRRYLNEGAFLRWAKRFGRRCPTPDFDAAADSWWDVQRRRLFGRSSIAALVGLAVVFVVAFWVGRSSSSRRLVLRVRRGQSAATIDPSVDETAES